jgi:hypothetical protein
VRRVWEWACQAHLSKSTPQLTEDTLLPEHEQRLGPPFFWGGGRVPPGQAAETPKSSAWPTLLQPHHASAQQTSAAPGGPTFLKWSAASRTSRSSWICCSACEASRRAASSRSRSASPTKEAAAPASCPRRGARDSGSVSSALATCRQSLWYSAASCGTCGGAAAVGLAGFLRLSACSQGCTGGCCGVRRRRLPGTPGISGGFPIIHEQREFPFLVDAPDWDSRHALL